MCLTSKYDINEYLTRVSLYSFDFLTHLIIQILILQLGPPLANFVPFSEALVLIGEIGLIFLLIEAGIELDLEQVKQTGTRAMAIALVGSILPIVVGTGVVMLIDDDANFKSALAVGFSFAPTSLGVASSALASGDASDTPVGQLIIAACVLTDIIGLLLLSMFQVLVDDDAKLIDYFIPIFSSFGLLLLCGLAAIYFLSNWIQKLLPMIPKSQRNIAMFVGASAMCMGYMPMMYYSKASYLAGAFLVGFTFSLVEGAHEKFVHSTHSMMEWLLRIFFAATIGFQVPVKLLFTSKVILEGLCLWATCVLVKLLVTVFVPRFSRGSQEGFNPYMRDILVTGFSMTCRGELNFIIAAFALDRGVIEPKMYAAITFAVLLSAITSPFILLQCLNYFNRQRDNFFMATNPLKNNDGMMPVHFHISMQTMNQWSLLDRIQTELSTLGLVVDDFRTGHSRGADTQVDFNIYCLDTKTRVRIPTIQDRRKLNSIRKSVKGQNDSSKHIWGSKKGIHNLTDEENEQLSLITDQLQEDETIISRQNEIEQILQKELRDLKVESLCVLQWTPWDWAHVLDSLSLKRANGKVASDQFLMELFDVADVDQSGTIEADEFIKVFLDGGITISREGLSAMIDMVDENRDGVISRSEWEQAVEYFKRRNHQKSMARMNSQNNEKFEEEEENTAV